MPDSARDSACRVRAHHRIRTLWAELGDDVRRYQREADPYHPVRGRGCGFWSALLMPALQCVLIHRFAHYLYSMGLTLPARFLSGLNHLLYKIRVPAETCVLGGLHLPHPAGLVVECQAGRNLTLYAMSSVLSEVTAGHSSDRKVPILGDNVTIAGDGSIIGPVLVGDGCRVSLCTRINQSLLSYSTAVSPTIRIVDSLATDLRRSQDGDP